MDGVLLVLTAEAAEAEQLVHRVLELQGVLLPVLVVHGQAPEPVRAHLHVGDLVGQHPVLAEEQHGVVDHVPVVPHGVEHVYGQALQGTVHPGEAQHGIGVAGRLEEEGLLGELPYLGAHVLGELDRDLDVAGLVPALAGHVQLELEGSLVVAGTGVEVVAGAPRPLQGLDLAHEDGVHEAPGRIGGFLLLGGEAVAQLRGAAGVEHHVLDADALEALVTGQIVDRQHPLHVDLLDSCWARVYPGAGPRPQRARDPNPPGDRAKPVSPGLRPGR